MMTAKMFYFDLFGKTFANYLGSKIFKQNLRHQVVEAEDSKIITSIFLLKG